MLARWGIVTSTAPSAAAEIAPNLRERIVFVTGDVADTDAEQFLEDTGCRWLAKPFRLRDLLRVVRELLG